MKFQPISHPRSGELPSEKVRDFHHKIWIKAGVHIKILYGLELNLSQEKVWKNGVFSCVPQP